MTAVFARLPLITVRRRIFMRYCRAIGRSAADKSDFGLLAIENWRAASTKRADRACSADVAGPPAASRASRTMTPSSQSYRAPVTVLLRCHWRKGVVFTFALPGAQRWSTPQVPADLS